MGSFGLYTGGSFTPINVPGASSTSASGINNSGQIVGSFNISMGQGFVDMGGSFTTIDVPGFCYTSAQGINDHGQIVGWVGFPASPEMAFIATPVASPEPSNLLTLATVSWLYWGSPCAANAPMPGVVRLRDFKRNLDPITPPVVSQTGRRRLW